jgi:hypothetical protein
MTPILSILVPAYQYADGVLRILENVNYLDPRIEIIISDDSEGDCISDVVQKIGSDRVTYKKRQNPNGAVRNWNALLSSAKGEFLLLCHHDEFVDLSSNTCTLLNQLAAAKEDVLIMPVFVCRNIGGRVLQHFPVSIATYLAKRHGNYIMRRNFVGPTAALLVRRTIATKFDENLMWLVDSAFYAEIFKKAKRISSASAYRVFSIQRHESITAQLAGQYRTLRWSETAAIAEKIPSAKMWISDGMGHRLLRASETLMWFSFRAFQRIQYIFARRHP